MEQRHRDAGGCVVHGPERDDGTPDAGCDQSAGETDDIAADSLAATAAVAGGEHRQFRVDAQPHEVRNSEFIPAGEDD